MGQDQPNLRLPGRLDKAMGEAILTAVLPQADRPVPIRSGTRGLALVRTHEALVNSSTAALPRLPGDRFALVRRLAYLATALLFALIVLGGIVRITGSGMGCGDDWPKCNGEWFPPLEFPKPVEILQS